MQYKHIWISAKVKLSSKVKIHMIDGLQKVGPYDHCMYGGKGYNACNID
jgi:hypothetical protein